MTLIQTNYLYCAQMVYLNVIYCFKQPIEDLELVIRVEMSLSPTQLIAAPPTCYGTTCVVHGQNHHWLLYEI